MQYCTCSTIGPQNILALVPHVRNEISSIRHKFTPWLALIYSRIGTPPSSFFQIVSSDADLVAALADTALVQQFIDNGFVVSVGDSSVTFIYVNEALEPYQQTGATVFAAFVSSITGLDGDAIAAAYVAFYLPAWNSPVNPTIPLVLFPY